jgi:hypothetical protein
MREKHPPRAWFAEKVRKGVKRPISEVGNSWKFKVLDRANENLVKRTLPAQTSGIFAAIQSSSE